jgi:GTP-binding protein
MFDLVQLRLLAGNGGNGRVSFRREKYIPKGGPDGGNGGHGGSIYLRANKSLNSLQHYAGMKEFVAQSGQAGGAKNQIGADGQDLYLEVPVGTRVWLVAENRVSRIRRRFHPTEAQSAPTLKHQILTLSVKGGRPDPLEPDEMEQVNPDIERDEVIENDAQTESHETTVQRSSSLKNKRLKDIQKILYAELLEDGEELLLAQGGEGGRGNTLFKSSTNTTPITSEYGIPGEQKEIILELRLIADVGLVGYPNAGKSTLLSVITRANPKIANYPFTTLEPNLGVMFSEEAGGRDIVLADIPGIIEGASEGKGLGYDFLRHVQACQALLFVLSLDEPVIYDESVPNDQKAILLWDQYTVLRKELQDYDQELAQKAMVVSLSKAELYDSELLVSIQQQFKSNGLHILPFSSLTRQGLDELQHTLRSLLS